MSDIHRYVNLVGEFLHQLHLLQQGLELRQQMYEFDLGIQSLERVTRDARRLQTLALHMATYLVRRHL